MDRRRASERGVAVITALLVVALAASTATYMLAQQSAMLSQATLVASRAQADLYARAGIDWARGVLAQDARTAGHVDTLEEGWAQPITGLPVERALVSGTLTDEQARFNLNNLLMEVGVGKSDHDLQILRRLLTLLEMPPDLAYAVLDWIDADSDLSGLAGAEDGHYIALARPYRAANQRMVQVDELYRIRGFTPERVAKLKPFVTALPGFTRVNINTAPEEVLAAVFESLSRDEVRALVAARKQKPFRKREDISASTDNRELTAVSNDLGWQSRYFVARIHVAQDDVQLATEALIARGDQNLPTAIIWRRPLY